MLKLEEKIQKEGKVIGSDILMVDHFLNHQLEVDFLATIAKEFANHFASKGINKILTVEASGIAIATLVGLYMNVPVVFAKKSKHSKLPNDCWSSDCESFTQAKSNVLIVAKKFLSEKDKLLLIDDFLAKGNAMTALLDIAGQASADVEGIGIVIEKAFQGGGDALRAKKYDLLSLAVIESMSENEIKFRHN